MQIQPALTAELLDFADVGRGRGGGTEKGGQECIYGNYTLLMHSLKSKNEVAEVQRVQLQPLHSFPRCEVQGAAAAVILNRCCTCSTSVNTFLGLWFQDRQ